MHNPIIYLYSRIFIVMAHFGSDFHKSNMRAVKCCVFILFVVALSSDALNCRSNTGPKENELKSIYTNCLKRQTQQGRDYSRNKSYGDDDWRDPRGHNQRDRDRPTSQWYRDDNQRDRTTQWDRDGRRDDQTDDYDDKMDNGRDDRSNNRDVRMYKNYRESNRDGKISNRGDIMGWGERGNNRYGRDNRNNERDERNNGNDRMYNKDGMMNQGNDRMYGRDDTMNQGNDRMYNRRDRINNRDDRMYSRNDRTDRGDVMNGNERMGNRDERMSEDRMGRYGYGREQVSSRDDIISSGEYGSDFSPQYSSSSTQFPHRYKREKRLGVSAGQRSKYNPHASSPRPSGSEDSYRNHDRNTSDGSNKTSEKIKACALHCFVENLEMTGDNGMPDKYLVTHVITKDVQNEDLRDFLQESIEECFQILDNENTEDKCEFSKNLLLCFSEKGRANCDDWKDDIQF